MQLNLASVASFMQKRKSGTHLPEKSEIVVDDTTKVEHPGEVCDLKGGRCAKLFGVGCAF